MNALQGRGSTPGDVLYRARRERGMTIDEVSRRSRVAINALEAIEDDDWDALPAPIYTRGFIKLFAEEVGVDPQIPLGLLEQGSSEKSVIEPSAMAVSARRAAEITSVDRPMAEKRWWVVAGVVAVAFLMAWGMMGEDEDRESGSDNGIVSGGSSAGAESTD